MSLKSSVKDLCPKVWVTAIKDAGRGLSPESPEGVRRFIWRPSGIWLVHSGHFLNESSFFLSLNQRLPQEVPRPWSPPIGIHLEPAIVLGFEIFLLVSRTLMTKNICPQAYAGESFLIWGHAPHSRVCRQLAWLRQGVSWVDCWGQQRTQTPNGAAGLGPSIMTLEDCPLIFHLKPGKIIKK